MKMNNQSDFGYAPSISTACVACGKSDLDCCDGKGNSLPEVVKFLFHVKRNLERQRRFGRDDFGGYRMALTQVEGDIEEWLIENGFLHADA
jgi:hypothetical protein